MALTFTTAPKASTPKKTGQFSWDSWYQKNRKALLVKRKARYKNDPAYREAIKSRSRLQRQTKAAFVPTDGYTISFSEMAKRLGTSVWVLRHFA